MFDPVGFLAMHVEVEKIRYGNKAERWHTQKFVVKSLTGIRRIGQKLLEVCCRLWSTAARISELNFALDLPWH
jgi:hypothetical protein